ncbi:MAG: ornithine cyclodeaminase family protein, partial [Burkholderiaceae bacterium]
GSMIPFLNAGQLSAALPYPVLVEALRLAFCNGAEAPRRHVHSISPDNDAVLLLMPVWQPERHTGVKIVTVAPRNPQRGLPSEHSVFMLRDSATGAPVCLMDGEELTLRRTAAASALASGYLSRPDSSRLLVVGTGSLAPYMAAAHCMVRPIRTVSVWGRSAEKAASTAALLRQQFEGSGIEVEVARDLEAAVREADVITCATTSTTPIVHGSWVQPGTHIDLVGGFRPNMREADDALMCSAAVFVDTWNGALTEAGDLVRPMEAGTLERAALQAELADLCAGRHTGRSDMSQVTLFKSVGAALEDLCAADLAWDYHQGQAGL